MGKNYNSSRLVNGLYVDASGNVAINDNTSSGYRLKVNGTLGVTGAATFSNDLSLTNGGMYYLQRLDGSAILPVLRYWNGTGNPMNGGGLGNILTIGTQGTNDFTIATDNTRRLTIASTGNVGIGTPSPASRLDVRVPAESPATGAVALIAGTSNGANDIFRWFDGTTQLGVFKNSGNVGIGTTVPQFTLALPQDSKVGWNDAGSAKRGSITVNSSADAMVFATGTSDTERMRIRANGNKTFNGPGGQDQMFSNYSRLSNGEYIQIDTESGGGNFQGFLIVANSYAYNAGYRSQGTYGVIGRDTTISVTTIASVNGGTGSSGFSITSGGTGIIRITNTGLYGDLIVSWRGFV